MTVIIAPDIAELSFSNNDNLVISDDMVLELTKNFDPNNPIIGWDNQVTLTNIIARNPDTLADVTDPDHPVTNLANPSTYLRFQQLTAGEDIEIVITLDGVKEIDFIGIANHNLGSLARVLRVWGQTSIDYAGNPVYTALTDEAIVGNDSVLVYRLPVGAYASMKFTIDSRLDDDPTDIVYMAVMYVGKLLVLERKIQVGFTPISMGRASEQITQRSSRGQFLGRLTIGSWVETAARITHLSPDWYREHMDAFAAACDTEPFFFAWAPVEYPNEVGFVWSKDIPKPNIHTTTGLIEVTLNMEGIA